MRQGLLDRAGLDRVWVQDEEQPAEPVAIGVDDPDLPVVDADGPWLPSRSIASGAGAAGSMAADAPALATWGLMLYTGQVLAPDLVEQMTTAPAGGWYGLGTQIVSSDGRDLVVGHVGTLGPYNSVLLVWPGERVAVAVLVPQSVDRPVESLAGILHEIWTTN